MAELTNQSKPTFSPYPEYDLNLTIKAKVYKQEGDLGYIYSPFRNLKISEGDYKGKLTGLRSNKFNFNLNNPVDIQVQPSYDGTVNLILNDDLNPPRLINSRFTVTEDKRFKIIDRKGDNDTNIYDQNNVDLETRLFKNYNKIPYLDFLGLQEGGNLQTGTYSFYFKYTDADGNESDIICESGPICVHDGGINDPSSISGGIQNKNCNKIIKLKLFNLDTTYDYVNIYYTRETGSDSFASSLEYIKIVDRKILNSNELEITITGFENKLEINKDLLNVEYNMVDRVKSQAQIQNMLFFGNVDKPTIPYQDLEDLSLRILPSLSNDNSVGYLNDTYKPVDSNYEHIEYYNMKNVYKYTGYWNNEIYRFGIVYILKDDSLSPVFNIRGCDNLNFNTVLQNPDLYVKKIVNGQEIETSERNYITINENGFYDNNTAPLENTKGVIRLNFTNDILKVTDGVNGLHPIAIDFNIDNKVLDEIKKIAKGFFFVRQKRIPTILAQGLTIGVDSQSYLPCLKTSRGFAMESFLDDNRRLTSDFDRHTLYNEGNGLINFKGLLSPELTLNKLVSAGLFNNSEFTLSNSFIDNKDEIVTNDGRHFSINSYVNKESFTNVYKSKFTSIGDGAPLKVIGNTYFSSLAGMAEEAFRFSYFGIKDKTTNARNLVRGLFTGFLGSSTNLPAHKIVNIHIPGYDYNLISEYFKIRFNSFYSYFAISDRYDINQINKEYIPNIHKESNKYRFSEYRGDCFINTVTVRMNRNFVDPETPINDTIVDYDTWKNNYLAPDDQDEKKDNSNINRADVNAVQLGHWVTFKVFSNINLALRSLDDSNSSEMALLGQARGFYPAQPMSSRSESKMPESDIFNAGYKTTTSKKEYVNLPDVPYIKNIFDNRIMFSSRHVNDAFQNGYRVFQGLSYQDITRQYGAITKIYNWQDNLLCIFENGIALLGINERALIQTETGQSIHMYGAGVLPDKETPISIDFGSRWADSIIRTPVAIYGVDTEAKKIWRFSQKGFEIISDFKIQKFLNDNLIMDYDEYRPIVGLRNVKSHYDNFKGDVVFTFYNCTRNKDEKWNLVYNERIGKWITKTSWTPLCSDNINNIFISFNKDIAKDVSLNAYTLEKCKNSEGIVLDDNIIKPDNYVGTLSIKGYDYYNDYNKEYYLINAPSSISIVGDKLYCSDQTLNSITIEVGVKLSKEGFTAPSFTEFLYLRKTDKSLKTSFLYKHGQANLFVNNEYSIIKPCLWYEEQHPFEFEFIINDKFQVQKIFNNLKIISNKVKPDELTVSVVGDSYEFKTPSMNGITSTQKIIDIAKHGRLRGNTQYKEDIWDIQIAPLRGYGRRETRIRDKYATIRIKYTGEDLTIITLIQTFYTISYA